jgi:uncharacterized protein YfiM (DUF2279 family)
MKSSIREIDIAALFDAMDARRVERGLSWQGVADEIWALSADLNARRRDHPLSPATLEGIGTRGDTSCQHALFVLRWLGRAPESFLVGSEESPPPLPDPGPGLRLRWNLGALYEALDSRRREAGLTWPELARELDCTPSQLTGIRTARFAIGMKVAMRIVQWLGRPAADFTYAAGW